MTQIDAGTDVAAPEAPFELVCSVADLPEVGAALAEVGGKAMSIVRDDNGHIHAIDDLCTHGAVSLSEGEVEGCLIECWLHGSRFDLNTGFPKSPPAMAPVGVYEVVIAGTDVYVDPTRRINDNG
ncbi:MAG: non-heme iron oxygenase ferredoxin subunit [Dermatophilus congolensis]|nr:non-heme iron oxygenase ferredoxin subunit [Dermatophilus congolensis]